MKQILALTLALAASVATSALPGGNGNSKGKGGGGSQPVVPVPEPVSVDPFFANSTFAFGSSLSSSVVAGDKVLIPYSVSVPRRMLLSRADVLTNFVFNYASNGTASDSITVNKVYSKSSTVTGDQFEEDPIWNVVAARVPRSVCDGLPAIEPSASLRVTLSSAAAPADVLATSDAIAIDCTEPPVPIGVNSTANEEDHEDEDGLNIFTACRAQQDNTSTFCPSQNGACDTDNCAPVSGCMACADRACCKQMSKLRAPSQFSTCSWDRLTSKCDARLPKHHGKDRVFEFVDADGYLDIASLKNADGEVELNMTGETRPFHIVIRGNSGKPPIIKGLDLGCDNCTDQTFDIEGSVSFSKPVNLKRGGTLRVSGSVAAAGDLTVEEGGTFEIAGGADISSSNGTIKNRGHMVVSSKRAARFGSSVTNDGQLSINSGRVTFAGGIKSFGNVTIAPKGNAKVFGTISFSDKGDGSSGLVVSGTLTVGSGATVTIGAPLRVDGSIETQEGSNIIVTSPDGVLPTTRLLQAGGNSGGGNGNSGGGNSGGGNGNSGGGNSGGGGGGGNKVINGPQKGNKPLVIDLLERRLSELDEEQEAEVLAAVTLVTNQSLALNDSLALSTARDILGDMGVTHTTVWLQYGDTREGVAIENATETAVYVELAMRLKEFGFGASTAAWLQARVNNPNADGEAAIVQALQPVFDDSEVQAALAAAEEDGFRSLDDHATGVRELFEADAVWASYTRLDMAAAGALSGAELLTLGALGKAVRSGRPSELNTVLRRATRNPNMTDDEAAAAIRASTAEQLERAGALELAHTVGNDSNMSLVDALIVAQDAMSLLHQARIKGSGLYVQGAMRVERGARLDLRGGALIEGRLSIARDALLLFSPEPGSASNVLEVDDLLIDGGSANITSGGEVQTGSLNVTAGNLTSDPSTVVAIQDATSTDGSDLARRRLSSLRGARSLSTTSTGTVELGGWVIGDATIDASLVTVTGTLAPGDSNFVGTLGTTGDFVFERNSHLRLDVQSAAVFDRVEADGDLYLGGMVHVVGSEAPNSAPVTAASVSTGPGLVINSDSEFELASGSDGSSVQTTDGGSPSASNKSLVGIIIGACVAGLLAAVLVCYCCCCRSSGSGRSKRAVSPPPLQGVGTSQH